MVDEVPNDQEIGWVTQLFNDPEFTIETGDHFIAKLAVNDAIVLIGVAFKKPLNAKLAEIVDRRFFIRAFEVGGKMFAQFQINVDGIRDLLTASNSVLKPWELFVHLFRTAKEELIVLHFHS